MYWYGSQGNLVPREPSPLSSLDTGIFSTGEMKSSADRRRVASGMHDFRIHVGVI